MSLPGLADGATRKRRILQRKLGVRNVLLRRRRDWAYHSGPRNDGCRRFSEFGKTADVDQGHFGSRKENKHPRKSVTDFLSTCSNTVSTREVLVVSGQTKFDRPNSAMTT